MLVGTGRWTGLESDLLALRLDIQLWPRHFNFIALLTDAFVSNIITLILVFFFVLLDLQMSVNESGGELVLCDCRCK
jgi:hypothetical protein